MNLLFLLIYFCRPSRHLYTANVDELTCFFPPLSGQDNFCIVDLWRLKICSSCAANEFGLSLQAKGDGRRHTFREILRSPKTSLVLIFQLLNLRRICSKFESRTRPIFRNPSFVDAWFRLALLKRAFPFTFC